MEKDISKLKLPDCQVFAMHKQLLGGFKQQPVLLTERQKRGQKCWKRVVEGSANNNCRCLGSVIRDFVQKSANERAWRHQVVSPQD